MQLVFTKSRLHPCRVILWDWRMIAAEPTCIYIYMYIYYIHVIYEIYTSKYTCLSLSLSQFVEIHKLHPKLSYIKFDVCSGGDSQTSWLCFRYFEFVPGMVRPYSNPDLHRKLVLDYAKVCSKMKAWQFEHSNVRLDWLGINTRSVYIYIRIIHIYVYIYMYIYICIYTIYHSTIGLWPIPPKRPVTEAERWLGPGPAVPRSVPGRFRGAKKRGDHVDLWYSSLVYLYIYIVYDI